MTYIQRAFQTGGIQTWGRNWAVKTHRLVFLYQSTAAAAALRE